ncbi:Uncharacterized protein TCAP_04902 [Tolypocladium capitatum]|uniref:Myb-like domain-containing protein n=1 Tax=Tolypocladium capitatum TaxID=45235 RepID=A0A2K3QC95_9HYPO|nr:Uncharacterized protein TCAP_04902 [Tolypocladium capitatum]
METRRRGARQREAESRVSATRGPSATRSTRQTAGQNTPATASNAPLTSPDSRADAPSNNFKLGSLLRNAISIPHRGAKVTKAFSVASLPTRTGKESEDEDEEGSRPQASHASASQDGNGSEADEDDMRQIMIAELPDLERAADELMTRLLNGDYGDKAFRAISKVKRKAFIYHRKSCLQPDAPSPSPFVDWAWLKDPERPTEMENKAANVFARANLVSALDCIRNARAGGDVDMMELLEALDSAIPTLFTSPGRNRPPPKMVVNVRACYAIKLLAMTNSKETLHQTIASVFCEATDNADFVNGPFRSLGDPREAEDNNLCSTIADELFLMGRRSSGVDQLRKRFPLDELLEELEKWIQNEYTSLQGSSRPSRPGPEHHHAEEDFEESASASNHESPPIVRARDTDKVPSLFLDNQSIRQLRATKSHSDAPPSNQQQATRNQTSRPLYAHADHQSSRQLLLAPDPVVNTARSGAKRAYVTAKEGNEEEANSETSDSFETDDRPVDNTKRTAIQSGLPASKRLRSSAPEPRPSSSQRILANPTQTHAAPSSSAPAARTGTSSQIDLGAIKRRTADASDAARIQQRAYRGGPRTRVPWSEDDTILLIELICETNASWAVIQSSHNHKFEYPRNQQAYRDKARNLKVEFLLSDAVLPPGFDHVALGSKEVIKIREKGKNHMRQEFDIDSRGNPINTEAYA